MQICKEESEYSMRIPNSGSGWHRVLNKWFCECKKVDSRWCMSVSKDFILFKDVLSHCRPFAGKHDMRSD